MAPTIGTHSGTFHCDESLACFMLKSLPQYRDSEITRTRDENLLKQLDIIVDVGGEYDPARHRYDHHQRGFAETFSPEFNTKLSSAGLIYKHFGREIIAHMTSLSGEDLEVVYKQVYKHLIEGVDGIDNGIDQYPEDIKPKYVVRTDLASRVSRLNPEWNDLDQDYNGRFQLAMEITGKEFCDFVQQFAKSWLPARGIVLRALEQRREVHPSGEIVRLGEFCPWKSHLRDFEQDMKIDPLIKFVLYTDQNGTWRVQGVNEENSFKLRLGLAEQWRGLRDAELSRVSGIPQCTFVHASGFTGGNLTYEGALQMAVQSLELASKSAASS